MDSNVPPEPSPENIPPPPDAPPFVHRPPVIAPVPASTARPASRGTGWKIFAAVLFVMLVISLLLNFQHVVSSLLSGKGVTGYHPSAYGPRLDEVTVRESSSTNKIVVVPIEGIISGEPIDGSGFSMVAVAKEELKRAREDDQVRAVILKVDSPGGEVLASDEIANAIREFQAKSGKPVIVSMGSLAASGGYYISTPCEYIVANELTITGSIGVIMHGLNYRGLLDKIGVRTEVFKSGKYKDMMSGTKSPDEISPEERQMVQDLIDETFGKFKSVVADGREAAYQSNKHQGRRLTANWQDFADGRILSGKEAYKLGFVDDLGDFDVAVDRTRQLAGITKAELIEYRQVVDFSDLFRMFGQSSTKSVKLDLGADFPKLRAGYLYFLSPTYLQ
jgi:protease-4